MGSDNSSLRLSKVNGDDSEMTAETMRSQRRTTYQNMHEIVKLAKKYSPKLVKGYSAGNISVVDKKSWLEVCDRKHR